MSKSTDLVKYIGDDVKLAEVKDSAILKQILNNTPNHKWLKVHPTVKTVKYLPIDKIELLLDMIFVEWRVEILQISQLAQSVCATVRVHYKNPISGQWSFHDGVGASPLQTNAGKSAADLAAIKANAVQSAAPAAKSYAIKDAVEHLGKLFGRDINRADTVGFSSIYNQEEEVAKEAEKDKEFEQYVAKLKSVKTLAGLQSIFTEAYLKYKTDPAKAAQILGIKDNLKEKLK